MKKSGLDSRLRVLQQAEIKDRVVLVRVDHNVVKKGRIKDPYRIEATFGTLNFIMERGGRPILLTHVGRPRNSATGTIECREAESVRPIIEYIEQKLRIQVEAPEFSIDPEKGILHLDGTIRPALNRLKLGESSMLYLPNSRWFYGEQTTGPERDAFAKELGAIADIYVNDAFGSYRAHASTYDVAGHLPSFAGLLLQKEIENLHRVLDPARPFVAVVAGAKYDTKIGPVKALHKKVDRLILGGLMYNTFISAKYGVSVAGVPEADRALAMDLVELDRERGNILELPYLVESDTLEEKAEGRYRTVEMVDLLDKNGAKYILDIDPKSLERPEIRDVIGSARTVFVNAVMGLTPHFCEGSRALYRLVAENVQAMKLFGGGDTLQEFKNLCPEIYESGLGSPDMYYFTGGGSVLAAIEKESPYRLEPVEALMERVA